MFVDPPAGIDDTTFDLHVSGGTCATLACDGGEVGAYGMTDCVGHRCSSVVTAIEDEARRSAERGGGRFHEAEPAEGEGGGPLRGP